MAQQPPYPSLDPPPYPAQPYSPGFKGEPDIPAPGRVSKEFSTIKFITWWNYSNLFSISEPHDVAFGEEPICVRCPHCNLAVESKIDPETGKVTWLSSIGCFILGRFFNSIQSSEYNIMFMFRISIFLLMWIMNHPKINTIKVDSFVSGCHSAGNAREMWNIPVLGVVVNLVFIEDARSNGIGIGSFWSSVAIMIVSIYSNERITGSVVCFQYFCLFFHKIQSLYGINDWPRMK